MDEILAAVHKRINQRLLLISPLGEVICYAGYDQSPNVELTLSFFAMEQYKIPSVEAWPEKSNVQINGVNVYCVVIPVVQKKKNIAFLLAVSQSQSFKRKAIDLLQATAHVFALEFDRKNCLASVEQKYKNEFILDLLLNVNQKTEKLELVSRIWGRNLLQPHLVFLAAFSSNRKGQKEILTRVLKSNLEQILGGDFIHLYYSNKHIILVNLKNKDERETVNLMRQVHKKVNWEMPEGNRLLFACQSLTRYDYNLGMGYREASCSLELGRAINEKSAFIEFDNLGLYRLLYVMCQNLNMEKVLGDFHKQKLGQLINYDEQNKTELYNTLIIYLENNCNISLTAEKLFVHPNSVRYRINKIEKLLKVDLSRLECMVEITLASKIDKMQKYLSGAL